MLRIKVPAGQLTAAELRTIGEVSNLYGKGDGELSTRQNIQLHWLELAKLPDVFAHLERSGVDDRRRLRRHRAQHHRLPGAGDRRRRALRRHADRRRGRRPLLRQPRLGEPAAEAQVLDLRLRRPLQRARDQLHLADRHRPREAARASRVLVGGGLSSVPRIARDMGVFIPKEEANEILGAITASGRRTSTTASRASRRGSSSWSTTSAPKGIRERVEARLGRTLEDYTLPPIDGRAVAPPRRPRAEAGRPLLHRRPGAPRPDLGRPDDRDRRPRRARTAATSGSPASRTSSSPASRTTRVDEASAELEAIGFPLDINPVRGNSIACTGEPHCNFSVAETKTRLGRLIERLEERFGDADRRAAAAPRRLPARLRAALGRRPRASRARPSRDEGGVRRQAYDIFVRGGLGPEPADRPLALPARADRRARRRGRGADRRAGSTGAQEGESFLSFARRASDDELGELAGLEPAKATTTRGGGGSEHVSS